MTDTDPDVPAEPVDDGASALADAHATAAFHQERVRLLLERQAAYATRAEDPDRWKAAKQAYSEFRTAIRVLDEPNRYANSSPVAETATVDAGVHNDAPAAPVEGGA